MESYAELKQEYEKLAMKASLVKIKMQEKCPHNNVTKTDFKDGILFKNNVSYICEECGISAMHDFSSWNEKMDDFELLEKRYFELNR